MGYTFDEVLDNGWSRTSRETRCVRLRIGSLETPVNIELGGFMSSERTKSTLSHVIKTP